MEKGTFQLGKEDKLHCLAVSFWDKDYSLHLPYQVFAYYGAEWPTRDEQTQMASSASSTLLLGFNFITCGLIFINKMKPTFFISLIFLLPGKDTSTQSLYKTSLYGIHILSTLPDFFKMNFMIHIYKIYTAYVILQTLVHHT